ncbi:putative mfs general substrate transporter protein [Botrytis fragariae]|uniref:Putative mfs general substrate transporter protein n=1 Tax=Botrytis fragariae TaxID=1964551 RepID=A0A8H6ARK8_9HELO|nr:putative mfs general substrate transporter protein [Botrytis fragariae]KAF5872337.1 putative mfs general substrate transporter protein [Botrytis fragariae]
MAGGIPISTTPLSTGFLRGKALIFPLSLVISLFFLWGFSYGLLDVLNKHFQTVLDITKLQSTGLQVVYFGGGYLLFSPIAAEVMKRKGYKITILMGLSLYSLGAIMFWPTAHFSTYQNRIASFGGFCACTLVIACGLATLETAANSYAVVIGDPASASARLQFCQSWNGVASFIGPLIAGKYFFSGENAHNLTNVQFVYLAVACAGVAIAVLFLVAKLPEVSEEMLESSTVKTENLALDEFGHEIGQGPIYKQYNMIFAFIAQFCYVGAQVTVASFFINYATENASYSSSQASNMLSYALITFTVGRFIATALATIFQADFLMIIYSVFAIAFTAVVAAWHGNGAVIILILLFFFEAPMYPTLFTMGTANLGRHTRRGAGILVMGVSGGAVFPPIQGAIADSAGTRISYVVPLVGFIYVLGYVTFHWIRHGRHIMRVKDVVAAEFVGGATGGVVEKVHYDGDKVMSVEQKETI